MNSEYPGGHAEVREILVKLLLMGCSKIHSMNGIPIMMRAEGYTSDWDHVFSKGRYFGHYNRHKDPLMGCSVV